MHAITSDMLGKARKELKGIRCRIQVLESERHLAQKEPCVKSLGKDIVAALGNSNNDAIILKIAQLRICICLKEGPFCRDFQCIEDPCPFTH